SLEPKSVALAQARQAAAVSRCGAQADQARTANCRPPAILLNPASMVYCNGTAMHTLKGSDVSTFNWGNYTAKHREYHDRHSVDVGVWHHSGRRFAALVIASR